jgi:hypothetical protein
MGKGQTKGTREDACERKQRGKSVNRTKERKVGVEVRILFLM